MIVSDGSWKTPHGSAAFLVGDTTFPSSVAARGTHLTPPPHPYPLKGSSYRSEIGGILLGGLTLTKFLDHIYQPPTGGVTVACDSLGALKQIFGTHPLNPQQADSSLVSPEVSFNHCLTYKSDTAMSMVTKTPRRLSSA